jgi:hypothetical protein
VEGFYDRVRPLTPKSGGMADSFEEAEYLREPGSPSRFGEPGFSTYGGPGPGRPWRSTAYGAAGAMA